eukprot:6077186-Prymnesium_polylepis.1
MLPRSRLPERRTTPWHKCDDRVSQARERTGYVSCGMKLPPGLPLAGEGTRRGSAIGNAVDRWHAHMH